MSPEPKAKPKVEVQSEAEDEKPAAKMPEEPKPPTEKET
jgi:hypothetical protein